MARGVTTLDVTLWRTFTRGRLDRHTWRSFIDTFVKKPEIVRDKKSVAGFSLGAFEGNKRALSRVRHLHALVLDLDHGAPTVEAVAQAFPRTRGIVYTTWSHEPGAPRLRAIFMHDRPVSAEEHEQIWLWAYDRCAKLTLELDARARDASHLFWLPSHRPKAEYRFVELKGRPINVDKALRQAEGIVPPRAVPWTDRTQADPGNSTRGALDRSPSGLDFQLCLERVREGDSDQEIAALLQRRSKKGDRPDYVTRTIETARAVHEAHTPSMSVEKATFHCLPPRFAYPEQRHIELELLSDDGEIVKARVLVPAPWDSDAAASTWRACFPDISPDALLGPWEDTREVWARIRWRHRRFEVAARNGDVRWIRAVEAPRRSRLTAIDGRCDHR